MLHVHQVFPPHFSNPLNMESWIAIGYFEREFLLSLISQLDGRGSQFQGVTRYDVYHFARHLDTDEEYQ